MTFLKPPVPPRQPDQPAIRPESILPNGLIVRHAYSITKITAISLATAPRLKVSATSSHWQLLTSHVPLSCSLYAFQDDQVYVNLFLSSYTITILHCSSHASQIYTTLSLSFYTVTGALISKSTPTSPFFKSTVTGAALFLTRFSTTKFSPASSFSHLQLQGF